MYFLAFLAFLSAFSACSSSIQNTSTVTTGDDALELIDVQKDKEDNTIVYIDSWQILNEYDAFREYFLVYGTKLTPVLLRRLSLMIRKWIFLSTIMSFISTTFTR